MTIVTLIASAALAADPIFVEASGCWALGWEDRDGATLVVAGESSDHRLLSEALGITSLSWYPWIFPVQHRPEVSPTTPMQECFAEARATCRREGEKVCFVYWIPGFGQSGEGGCFVGCSVNGVCGNPPPIPPVPAKLGSPSNQPVISALVYQAAVSVSEGD